MSELFLEVLNTGIAASWVVLAVFIARLLLRKAPRSLVCGLWALVGVRLVIGRTLEAPFSLIPSAEVITQESLLDRAPVIHSGVPIIDRVVNPVYTESFRANPVASVNPLQVWMAVWAMIWVLGMIVMLLWAFVSWLRICRRVRESIEESRGIFLCDRIDSPFILGILRPKIYLPSDLDDGAKAHVIAHEKAHTARHDHWWKPMGYLLLTIYWFNPVLWLAYVLLCRDIEMACDERVVRELRIEEKKAYSAALLRCSISRRTIAACPLAFGEVGVKARIKSVLSYKKPAFWVILVTLVLIAALAAGLLTSPESAPAEIRWGGVLYIQEGDPVDFMPDKQQTIGSLRSILHDSTKHPEEDGQAVRLGWEYAGQPLVTVGNALYLEQPGGGRWLPFRLRTPESLLTELVQGATVNRITVRTGEIVETEELIGDRGVAMSMILDDVRHAALRPGSLDSEIVFSVSVTRSGERDPAVFLNRDSDGAWELVTADTDYGESHWIFECEQLEAQAQSYLSRAQADDAAYDAPVEIDYQTFHADGIYLRIGIPNGWEAEQKGKGKLDGVAFRFWPEGAEGFIQVQYETGAGVQIDGDYNSVDFTFPNGVTGKRYEKSGRIWRFIEFQTTQGSLQAVTQNTSSWTEEQLQTAQTILSTVSAFANGTNIMADGNLLGIHLRAENVTPSGLTLVCVQDGTPWKEILTGSPWSLEQWTEEGWVSAMPEDTFWTTVAYSVPQNDVTRWNINWSLIREALEPGTYRIGKHFTATPVQPPWGGVPGETVEETVYAEFTIQ